MKLPRRVYVWTLLAALSLSALWFGWRWYTTPMPPDIALDGLYPEIVAAVRDAQDEVRRQPRSGESWGKLAMVLSVNGFEAEALECLLQAEHFAPHDAHWPYFHGNLLLEQNPRAALTRLRRALELSALPENRATILFRMALALIENHQLADAEQVLEDLRQIEADGPRVRYGQALLAVARDDRVVARAHLTTLIDHPMARKRVYRLLASLETDDAALARTYAQQAAKLPIDVSWPDAFEVQRQSHKVDRTKRVAPFLELEREGRHAEARAFLRKLLAEAPDGELWFRLGFAALQQTQLDEAEQAFRAALQYDARNVKTHVLLGTVLLLRGQQRFQEAQGQEAALALFRQAVAAADQALKLQELGQSHFVRGQALKYLGQSAEALSALRQAVLCQPESVDFHLALGEALTEASHFPEALEHLEYAVQLAAPDNSRPREALEKCRAQAKKAAAPGK